MKGEATMKIATAIVAVLLGFLLYHIAHPVTRFAAEGIDPAWDSAVVSRDATEPTVVIFTAAWCGACQQLHSEVLSQSCIQDELFHHYNVHTVDLTSPSREVQMQAGKLGVSSIPTLIRYDTSGRETDRRHGGSPEDVLAWLKAGE